MIDPACEVNEKGTRENNDGNGAVEEGTSPPLDLDPYEVIEVDEKSLPSAEEHWETGADRGSQEHGTGSTLFNADKTK